MADYASNYDLTPVWRIVLYVGGTIDIVDINKYGTTPGLIEE